jgi:SulP family sulfate permease
VVLDFRQTHSLDASATLSISKMKQLAQRQGFILIFTSLSPAMRRQLAPEVLTAADQDLCQTFPDLDHALEWCEEQILAENSELNPEGMTPGAGSEAFSRLLAELAGKKMKQTGITATTDSMKYVVRQKVAAGNFLIRQGDPPKGLYFLQTGQMTAQLALNDGQTIRLRTMRPGTIIGELSVYAQTAASASVVALEPSTVYFLSTEHLEAMERDDPETAAEVHRYIVQLVSERLLDATDSIRALLA